MVLRQLKESSNSSRMSPRKEASTEPCEAGKEGIEERERAGPGIAKSWLGAKTHTLRRGANSAATIEA